MFHVFYPILSPVRAVLVKRPTILAVPATCAAKHVAVMAVSVMKAGRLFAVCALSIIAGTSADGDHPALRHQRRSLQTSVEVDLVPCMLTSQAVVSRKNKKTNDQ